MRKKLKSQKGFSTVELLLCCILLILFTAILSLGTGLVANTLKGSMGYSEAQSLNGILTNAISDQIRFQDRLCIFAKDNGGKNVVYVRDEGNSEDPHDFAVLSSNSYPNGINVESLKISEVCVDTSGAILYNGDGTKKVSTVFESPGGTDSFVPKHPTTGKLYEVTLKLRDSRGELSSSTFDVKCHYGSGT